MECDVDSATGADLGLRVAVDQTRQSPPSVKTVSIVLFQSHTTISITRHKLLKSGVFNSWRHTQARLRRAVLLVTNPELTDTRVR